MSLNQGFIFFIFTINGIFIGILFDFFRILRKSFKTANFITYIEDILFWIFAGISIIFSMYNFTSGDLRIYMLIGIFLGIVFYLLTISKFIINISMYIINFIKKIISIIIVPFKIIFNFLKKFVKK